MGTPPGECLGVPDERPPLFFFFSLSVRSLGYHMRCHATGCGEILGVKLVQCARWASSLVGQRPEPPVVSVQLDDWKRRIKIMPSKIPYQISHRALLTLLGVDGR